MAYDSTKPANDGYLANAPSEIRNNTEGLRTGRIVDAGSVQGLVPGNASGNIPISNGTLNTNLNADKLDGYDGTYYAPATHTHNTATSSSNGFMSNTDKAKLDTIATGAEVNQNAFSNVLVGSTTIQADSKTDTLEIVPGANIAVTPDATNDRITIAVTGKVPSAANADYSNYATAAGDANTVDGKHASDFVSQFSINANYATVNYVKIAELTTNIGSGENGLVLYVNGIADYGDNMPGMDIVQVSTRGSVSLKVYKVIPSIREDIQYGYVNNATTGKTEIWIKRDAYNYGVNIIVAQSKDATVGILTTQSTEPSGITYVPREYFIYASDVVTTPTANKILKLDANGKLPASITGDAATVGGKTPGTGANNVLVLDANAEVPQGNLPDIPSANLPIASASTLGAIKVGTNLGIDANGVLSATAPSHSKALYTTPGTYTFTVPTGVTEVYVTMCGGGGGGGGHYRGSDYENPGGGGGGAHAVLAQKVTGLTPGQQITVTVGNGGNGGAKEVNGSAGGTSSFGSYISCPGGGGGRKGGSSENTPGTGGAAGGTGGTNGRRYMYALYGLFLHPAGGNSIFGNGNEDFGVTGTGYGSGGSGGDSSVAGGKGADGFVLIEW